MAGIMYASLDMKNNDSIVNTQPPSVFSKWTHKDRDVQDSDHEATPTNLTNAYVNNKSVIINTQHKNVNNNNNKSSESNALLSTKLNELEKKYQGLIFSL